MMHLICLCVLLWLFDYRITLGIVVCNSAYVHSEVEIHKKQNNMKVMLLTMCKAWISQNCSRFLFRSIQKTRLHLHSKKTYNKRHRSIANKYHITHIYFKQHNTFSLLANLHQHIACSSCHHRRELTHSHGLPLLLPPNRVSY